MDAFSFILAFITIIVILVILITSVLLFRPWLHASFSGAAISLTIISGMRLRSNPPKLLSDAYIIILHGQETTSINVVESVYIANKSHVTDTDSLVRLVREYERTKEH